MAIAAITKITTKVAMCLYVNKMVLTTTMAKYKLEFSNNAPNIIIVTRYFGLPITSSQTKVSTRLVEL